VCGRYTLTAADPAALRARFGLSFQHLDLRPRYNVAPGDAVLAITLSKVGEPRAELLRWGLVPPFVKAPGTAAKMINARAETLAEKPAYRGAFARFRCLILADGFYEWASSTRPDRAGWTASRPRRRPFWITRADHAPFAFAGLWSVWHRGQADAIRSCTIITTAPNAAVAPLHDRMPAILDRGDERRWLDPGTPAPVLHELLHGLSAAETALRPVGPAVNDARHDGPDCLAAPKGEPERTLF
jgi:putative SOS response-associated peptidase YedK